MNHANTVLEEVEEPDADVHPSRMSNSWILCSEFKILVGEFVWNNPPHTIKIVISVTVLYLTSEQNVTGPVIVQRHKYKVSHDNKVSLELELKQET